jgi:hypothetical protein
MGGKTNMITKILKNQTANSFFLINMEIPANGEIFVEATMWAKLIQNGDVFRLIEMGTLVVNNGTRDLGIAEAIHHMYLFQDEPAPTTNGHFSYRRINSGVTINIPVEQQMISYQEISVEFGGELDNEGEVLIIR